MADVLEALHRRGSLYVAAAQEIVSLREAKASLEAQVRDLTARAAAQPQAGIPAERPQFKQPEIPPPPRPHKAIGTATTAVGRELLQYTASDMGQQWMAGYHAGWAAAHPTTGGYSKANGIEDDGWTDYNAGRGPRPTRAPLHPKRKRA